jgi:type II secretory pathway pseudopilin PulG
METPQPEHPRRPTRAARWVDMSVVAVILGIVALVLIPVFQPAKEGNGHRSCSNNQKRIANATTLYVVDHADTLPPADGWPATLGLGAEALICPQAPKVPLGYVYNAALDGRKLDGLGDHTNVLVTTDGANPARPGVWESEANTDWTRHEGISIRGYLDGHVTRVEKPPTAP